jgi:hypothetical protein
MNNPWYDVEVDGRKFTVIKQWITHRAASVQWSGEQFHRGTAEAEQIATLPEDWWWVNRVLVQPPEARCNGAGSELVRQLSIAAHESGCRHLVVCPGGYVNTEREKRRQIAFYEKNGFAWNDEVPFNHSDCPTRAMVLDLG